MCVSVCARAHTLSMNVGGHGRVYYGCMLNSAKDGLSTLRAGLELSPSALHHGRTSQLLVPVTQEHPDSDSVCISCAAYHCEQMPEKRQLEGGKIYFASWFWRLDHHGSRWLHGRGSLQQPAAAYSHLKIRKQSRDGKWGELQTTGLPLATRSLLSPLRTSLPK